MALEYPEDHEHLVARRHAPPDALPTKENSDSAEVSLFGQTNFSAGYGGKRYVFGIKRRDRSRHLYVIGKSGVGKTKLLELLIRADVFFGHGACVIDPHGDLIQSVMDFVPEDRIDDVVIINPADREFPISFNPIANVEEAERFPVTNQIIEIFKKQFGSDWSPRIEHLLRFTTLAMIEYPGGTFNDMVALLSNGQFRSKVIGHVHDDLVRRFWAVEFAEWSQRYDKEAVSPLLNKLGQLLADPLMRRIFGQKENKIDFFDFMQNDKIVLVNLAKGVLGDDVSSFFGAIVVTKINQAAMRRVAVPEAQRKRFYLYVDEFQNIATKTFENMLAESRKFGLAVTVANQNLSQLSVSLKSSLFGNVGSIITFQVSADDAKILQDELAPVFAFNDIINLEEREIYVKMTIDGKRFDPFSAEVLTVTPPKNRSRATEILHASRDAYAAAKEVAGDAPQAEPGEPAAPVVSPRDIIL